MTNPYNNIGNGFSEIICDKKRYINNSKCWECPVCGQEGCDDFSTKDPLHEGTIECPRNGENVAPSYDI